MLGLEPAGHQLSAGGLAVLGEETRPQRSVIGASQVGWRQEGIALPWSNGFNDGNAAIDNVPRPNGQTFPDRSLGHQAQLRCWPSAPGEPRLEVTANARPLGRKNATTSASR